MRNLQLTLPSTLLLVLLCSSSAFADADAVKGKQLFNRCSACHSTEGQNKSGPPLNGVSGRKAGIAQGYNYSPAIVGSNVTWTDEALDRYLAGPTKMIRGSRMSVSITREQDRADLISYLKTLGGAQ